MKIKLLLSLVVCVCSFIFAFTNMSNVNCSNVLSLVNVESLANDETDDGASCISVLSSNTIMFQECSVYNRTYETVYRKDFLFECSSASSGSCDKGHFYQYYDCDGYLIDSCDETRSTRCQEPE